MRVNKQQLLEAVKKVLPGVASGKSVLEGADSIIFSEKGLHSFNTRISVTVPFEFEEPFQCAVNGKDLYNLLKVKNNNDEECSVVNKEDSLKISGLNWNSLLKHIEIDLIKEKIELLNVGNAEQDLPENFSIGLNLCYITGNKKVFSGVYIKGQHVYSTNKQIMNIYTLESEMDEFWVGQESVKEFIKLQNIFCKYSLSSSDMGEWVHFKDTEGAIFSTALKDTSIFSPALKFMESNRKSLVMGETDISGSLPEGFSEAISACANMASATDDTKQKHVQIVFSLGTMILRGSKAAGKLQYMLEWGDDVKNLPIGKISYNFLVGDLSSASKKVSKFFVKPTGSNDTLLVFYNTNFLTVLINTQ